MGGGGGGHIKIELRTIAFLFLDIKTKRTKAPTIITSRTCSREYV